MLAVCALCAVIGFQLLIEEFVLVICKGAVVQKDKGGGAEPVMELHVTHASSFVFCSVYQLQGSS